MPKAGNKKSVFPKFVVYAIIIVAILCIVGFVIFTTFPAPLACTSGLCPACITNNGYLCQNPYYNHATGNLTITIGQNSSTNWTTANVTFVPYLSGAGIFASPYFTLVPNGLPSGSVTTITLKVGGPVPIGTILNGTIHVRYTTATNDVPVPIEIARLYTKAV